MPVTIRDVARRAGVSTATVSRVMSGASASRPATAAAVHEAAETLAYRPSRIARSLKLRSTRTIGLIVTDVQNPFFPELVRAVEDVALEMGFAVLLCNAAGDADREAAYLALLEEWRVDGMIIAANDVTRSHAPALRLASIPVVVVNSESPDPSIPAILSDNRGGGRLSAEHLAARGHRRIAALVGPGHHADAAVRVDGVRDGLAAAGLDPRALALEEAGATVDGGAAAVRRLLARSPGITGLVCYNDLVAIGAIRAMHASGRRVPADVSVVGFDDIDAAAWVEPPLTTVSQQKVAMGRWAVERISAEIDGERGRVGIGGPERVVLPVTLHVRDSTGPAAGGRSRSHAGRRDGRAVGTPLGAAR